MEKLTAISLNGRYVLMVFFLIFGVFFSFHLVHQPVIDWDEEVYLHLSKQMTWTFERYTTQNSHIDQELPQAYYRSPLFHHPPLVPLGIKLLSFAGSLVGAKILNLILWGASIYLVYAIACKFTDLRGAILALGLWVVCPIVNLEARLVHLDFPSTVLILLGFWFFLRYQDQVPKRRYLALAGVAFALAMLTKYTAPLLVVLPVLLLISNRQQLRDWKVMIIFGGTIALGFTWWLYVFIKFGSMMPPGFSYGVTSPSVTPYLKSISKRNWWDLWIYFLAICPLFAIYLFGAGKLFFEIVRRRLTLFDQLKRTRLLVVANVAIWIFVLMFSFINSQTNGFWMFRQIMPVFPFIYISIGVICSRLLDRNEEMVNSFLVIYIIFTIVTMAASTALTGLEVRNLKPIPISLYWFQMGHLFH
jgi:4-amino-4-deoxy-L-arabinose transferase-like glycosyltransferase